MYYVPVPVPNYCCEIILRRDHKQIHQIWEEVLPIANITLMKYDNILPGPKFL